MLSVWDLEQSEVVATLTYEFPIIDVKLTSHYVLVAIKNVIFVYDFEYDEGLDTPYRIIDDV